MADSPMTTAAQILMTSLKSSIQDLHVSYSAKSDEIGATLTELAEDCAAMHASDIDDVLQRLSVDVIELRQALQVKLSDIGKATKVIRTLQGETKEEKERRKETRLSVRESKRRLRDAKKADRASA